MINKLSPSYHISMFVLTGFMFIIALITGNSFNWVLFGSSIGLWISATMGVLK